MDDIEDYPAVHTFDGDAAVRVLVTLHDADGETLPGREIADRCGISHAAAYRKLYGLEDAGLVEKVEKRWRARMDSAQVAAFEDFCAAISLYMQRHSDDDAPERPEGATDNLYHSGDAAEK